MTRIAINIAGLLLAVTSLCVTGASAASLLGVVGTNGDSGVVTLSGGQAQTNGVVNVGLGVSSSNPNNVANVGIGGGSTPLATANVSSGGSSGVLSVDANVGNGLANVAVELAEAVLVTAAPAAVVAEAPVAEPVESAATVA